MSLFTLLGLTNNITDLFIHLIDGIEITHVLEEDVYLYKVTQGCSNGFECLFDVSDALSCMLLYISTDELASCVRRDLSGDVDESSRNCDVRVDVGLFCQSSCVDL